MASVIIGARIGRSAPAIRPLRDAPPPAHTGGFGEPTCAKCHWELNLNDPAGTLSIEGVPPRFAPGAAYRITISVRHPELAAAGFELASRYETGPDSGRQAGTLRALDDRAAVTLSDSNRIQYAHHVRLGAVPAVPGVGRWTIEWRAPAAPDGRVIFHLAANAANDNDSELGDFIYTKRLSVASGEKQ
jgi:hypothetical protein